MLAPPEVSGVLGSGLPWHLSGLKASGSVMMMPKGLNGLLSPLGSKQLCEGGVGSPRCLKDPEGTVVTERIAVSGEAQSTRWKRGLFVS